jgi:type II restriction enzyme
MKLSASNVVKAIDQLPQGRIYEYPNKKTKTKICVHSVSLPVGPIKIERFIKNKSGKATSKIQSISKNIISRYANSFSEGIPVNIDRVLGASYNTRSSLEALLAATPEFYLCKPNRIQIAESSSQIKTGHKHLMWKPTEPHENGIISTIECDLTISERPSVETVYGVIQIPEDYKVEVSVDAQRRHTQIQILLAEIGNMLNFSTYIAANDQHLLYRGKPLLSLPNVVPDLSVVNQTRAWPDAVENGRLIDCIWFKNGRLMPAVMEVEHTTGVTSGLVRMKKFKDSLPAFNSRYVIVAADEDRDYVFDKCRESIFSDLNVLYFPYSAVEELWWLCDKRKVGKCVTDEFLDCFMENTKAA